MKAHIQVKRAAFGVVAAVLAACAHPWSAFAAPPPVVSLESMTIEELMNIQVYSVSRKLQRVQDSAAAVFVITGEDIRRSGATSIPEALRMAPGLDVARIDGNKWAVTSRGFNSQFANKLLVLIDGRSVYTPLFSGVFWDVQDTLLEDVDRIEVIRGPGAALWGANAVNGVINILTKTAKQSQGGLLTAGAGNVENGFGGGGSAESAETRSSTRHMRNISTGTEASTPAATRAPISGTSFTAGFAWNGNRRNAASSTSRAIPTEERSARG
jgi:outer membrane cobalamin receptor